MFKTIGNVKVFEPTEAAHLESEKNAHGKWRIYDGHGQFRLAFLNKEDAYDYALKYGHSFIGLAQWNEKTEQNEYINVTEIANYVYNISRKR